jgi:hypothetical protein
MLERNGNIRGTVEELFGDLKKNCYLVKKEIIFITEFGIAMHQVRLVRMCLQENYSQAQIVKHLYDTFPTSAFNICFRVAEEEASKGGWNLSGVCQHQVWADLISKNLNMKKKGTCCVDCR